MHPAGNRPDNNAPASMLRAMLSVALTALSAIWEMLAAMLCRLLVHLAADPYPAAELYDPSEGYELAREVLAMENLITGPFGSIVGPGRVMRLFGGIEPLPGLVHCTAATRSTDEGDYVFLSFELDPLMLDEHEEEPCEYSVQIIRTPAADRWQAIERDEFLSATAALVCFFSDEPVRIGRD